jgi:hypothetical protein
VSQFVRASELENGDDITVNIDCRILSVVAVGKSHVRIRLEMQNQRALEFTDDTIVIEFLCRSNKRFHVWRDWGDDDDGDEIEPVSPSPADLLDA